MEITPYVKYAVPEKLGNTNFVFGHTEDITSLNNMVGTLPRYAYQNGSISLTYEVVQHLRWTPIGTDRIFGFSDTEEMPQGLLRPEFQVYTGPPTPRMSYEAFSRNKQNHSEAPS